MLYGSCSVRDVPVPEGKKVGASWCRQKAVDYGSVWGSVTFWYGSGYGSGRPFKNIIRNTGTFTSFKDKKSLKSYITVEIKVLLGDGRIRSRIPVRSFKSFFKSNSPESTQNIFKNPSPPIAQPLQYIFCCCSCSVRDVPKGKKVWNSWCRQEPRGNGRPGWIIAVLRIRDILVPMDHGSVPLTNESGCGSGRPKNIWKVRNRMRIRNTGIFTSFFKDKSHKEVTKQ